MVELCLLVHTHPEVPERHGHPSVLPGHGGGRAEGRHGEEGGDPVVHLSLRQLRQQRVPLPVEVCESLVSLCRALAVHREPCHDALDRDDPSTQRQHNTPEIGLRLRPQGYLYCGLERSIAL